MTAPKAQAEFGLQLGFGLPFVSQYGLNYQVSKKLGFTAALNNLDVSIDTASVKLGLTEFTANYHPFEGSFFLGLGAGMQNFEASATDSLSLASAATTVDSTVVLAKLGWMWGVQNGGFWMGLDMTYVSPMASDISITGSATVGSQEYNDVLEAAQKFAETAYTNITFLRIGYLF